MSTLTGLIGGGGGGGLASPTSSSLENTDANNVTIFSSTEQYDYGTRSGGTHTIFSLTGSGYIWYLKHDGRSGASNIFRGANAKIVVDGSDIIQQTGGDAGGSLADIEMVGSLDTNVLGAPIIPILPFSTSFSFQISVPGSLQSADNCNLVIGWCLK